MIKLFVFLFVFLLSIHSSFAYDLVLPKEKKSIVNSNYAFFVGKASKTEDIYINDEKIYIAQNGAFAHSVKLKEGENRIVLKSNFNTQIYSFYKNKVEPKIKSEVIEFEPKVYMVKNDNTPLRSSPIDFGMNRLSHLFKDTYLLINGEKDGFYRVVLSQNKIGWITKESVVESDNCICPKFVMMNNENFKNANKYTIRFTENLPYTIEENDKEILFKVYNPFVSDKSVYTINIKKTDKYSYSTCLNNGIYEFKITDLPIGKNMPLENLVIVVDAGHGGSEMGAIGCLGDKEKDINLKIALELKEILSSMGATVILTRECDGNVSLDDRVKIAKDNYANIFLSIHLNSIPDIKMDIHKNRGTSVYYYNQNSKMLANYIESSLTAGLNTRKDGVKTASFAVIRPTEYIGVLIEVAYMTNPMDSLIYLQKDFPKTAANSIAEGVLKYYSD